MRVVVAGATGAIGIVLTRQLLAGGHEVVGLTRRAERAESLRAIGAEVVVADVMDRRSLLTGLDGTRADAVIHQATALARTPMRHRDLDGTNALRTHGTANLVAAARKVGAPRFVTQSFLFGYGYRDHGHAPVTEDAPFGGPGRGAFDRHLSAMRSNEEQVLGASDLEGIALRYGMFYGDEPSTLSLFDQADRHLLPAPRHGGTVSLVHLEDASAAAVAALHHGRPGQAYNIADDRPTDWTTYFTAVAAAAGAPPPRLVPNWAFRLSPYLGTLMVRSSLALDTRKAKQELDWAPRYPTVDDGLAAIAERRRQKRAGTLESR